MPYDNLTGRDDAGALIPEEVVTSLLTKATEQSAAMTLFRRIPMNRAQSRVPVLSALPLAYWVTGDTGQKQTTELAWQNKFINAEEIATILPVPNNVADDVDFNIWDEAEPLLAEAVARTLDSTVFFGTNAPSSFPTNISSGAQSTGNSVTEGTTAAQGGFFGDFDNVLEKLEDDGFDYDGVVARRNTKSKFRKSRNTQGNRLDPDRISSALDEIDGNPITYTMAGLWPTNTRLFVGDWKRNFVFGLRKDISFEMFREGVIQDNTGAIVYNLLQQDMSAMRVTFRGGWQVANLINHDQPQEANRYPAAVLRIT